MIRGKLLEAVPELKEVYILSKKTPGSNPAMPYAALSQEADSGGSPWKGWRYPFHIRLYAPKDPDPTRELDALTASVTGALDKQLLGDETAGNWVVFSEGQAGPDTLDEENTAVVRLLSFASLSPRPLAGETLVISDPWLTALVAWTQQKLGANWSVYSGNWPSIPTVPSILWRITETTASPRGLSSYELQKKATAYIQAKDSDEEHTAFMQLVEGLGAAAKIPLGADERTFVRVNGPQVNTKSLADGYAATGEGPLTVALSRRVTLLTEDPAPLMQFVHYESHI